MLIHKNLRVLNFKKIKNHYQKNIKTYSKGSSRTGESKLNLLSSILIEKGGLCRCRRFFTNPLYLRRKHMIKNEKINMENDAMLQKNQGGKKGRTLKDLNLMDDFLFDVATEDLETCKTIIEFATGKRLKSLRWKEGQKVIHNLPGKRGIRMDFVAEEDDGTRYDVEMQKENQGNLPKRTRFYQALNDAPLLKSGEVGFDKLQPLEIIVICDFDLFKKGKYRYTFENRCEEVPELVMGDECRKIFLNTNGTNAEEVEPELVDFLHYITESNDTGLRENSDHRLKDLHHKIQQIKASDEMEASFMKAEERERLIREKGREEGREEGRRQVELIKLLLEKKQYDDAKRVTEDEEYCEQLCEEYNI